MRAQVPSATCIIVSVLLPIVLAYAVFGPGSAAVEVRVALGILWVMGGLIVLPLAAISSIVRHSSRSLRRISLAVLCGYGIALLWLFSTVPTQQSITAMINRNIPVGSSKSQVVSFLSDRGIMHDETGEGLTATIPDGIVNGGESHFVVLFDFDKNGKMGKFAVRHWQESADGWHESADGLTNAGG